MPQLAPVTVSDRAATPVDITYVPSTKEGDTAVFLASEGIPVGDKKLTVTLRKSGGRVKAKLVFTDPVLVTETINGVARPSVDRSAFATLELSFAATSTAQERKDLVGKMASALDTSQTQLMGVLQDLEGMY